MILHCCRGLKAPKTTALNGVMVHLAHHLPNGPGKTALQWEPERQDYLLAKGQLER